MCDTLIPVAYMMCLYDSGDLCLRISCLAYMVRYYVTIIYVIQYKLFSEYHALVVI